MKKQLIRAALMFAPFILSMFLIFPMLRSLGASSFESGFISGLYYLAVALYSLSWYDSVYVDQEKKK